MSKISNLAGETALYGLGSIVPRAINFLLFPLHTRVFNPEDYGVVSYLYIFAAFLTIIYTFGMETAYFRHATKEKFQTDNADKIFNLAQTAIMGTALIFSVLLIVFAGPIAEGLSIPGKSHYVMWLAGIVFMDAAVAIPFAKLRLIKRPLQFASAKIFNVLILLGLNLYFFVIAKGLNHGGISFDLYQQANVTTAENDYGIEYVFLANLIANGFYFIFFFKTFLKWRPAWDSVVLPSMLAYALPIMVTGLAGAINELFSRWALEWWLPPNYYPGKSSMYALGIFSAAYKYAIIMNLAIQAFRFAAEPFFFSNARNKNSPQLFARTNHLFVIFMSAILLAVVTNLDILKLIAGHKDYYDGLVVVPMLLCGYLFLGVHYNFSVWFKLTDKTYYGTFIALGGIVITIGLNFILIPIWGYVGSSWVTPICYLSMATACYITGQKNFPVPYKILSSLGYLLFALLLSALSYQFTFDSQWLATGFHIILLALFVFTAYMIEIKKLKIFS